MVEDNWFRQWVVVIHLCCMSSTTSNANSVEKQNKNKKIHCSNSWTPSAEQSHDKIPYELLEEAETCLNNKHKFK